MAKYAYVYDENNADLLSESRQLVENTGVALRRFQHNIPVGEWDALLQEMWATRLYVDNPQADRKAGQDPKYRLAGRWRVASLRKSGPGEPIGIYEELRLGWLQPPGTDGDYPSSGGDSSNWAGIDAAARIVRMQEFDDSNRAIVGENRFYTLVIPGVATKTIKEFCAALAARGTLASPTFGVQTAITGSWKIRGVRNEDQGDGSSNVICSLASVDVISAGEITFNDNWNETAYQMYFKNLADYPTAPFPPVNIDAIDNPDNWNNQLSPATIYQVTGAGIDANTGLWTINYSKRVAKPDEVYWGVPDNDGGFTQGHFWNQTKAWVEYKTANVLSPTTNNGFSASRNEFNLYDGSYTVRGANNSRHSTHYYDKGWYDEIVNKFRWDHGGHYIMEVWRITCCYKYGDGIAEGLDFYHQGGNDPTGGTPLTSPSAGQKVGPPLLEWSHFHPIGSDEYQFKRTVKAALLTIDQTSTYEYSSRTDPEPVSFVSNVAPFK
jgi:hypothetical protein